MEKRLTSNVANCPISDLIEKSTNVGFPMFGEIKRNPLCLNRSICIVGASFFVLRPCQFLHAKSLGPISPKGMLYLPDRIRPPSERTTTKRHQRNSPNMKARNKRRQPGAECKSCMGHAKYELKRWKTLGKHCCKVHSSPRSAQRGGAQHTLQEELSCIKQVYKGHRESEK